jgi:hypothetical protein
MIRIMPKRLVGFGAPILILALSLTLGGTAGASPGIGENRQEFLKYGDVQCDSDVDSVDALMILRYVTGLSVTQNEPCPEVGQQVYYYLGLQCPGGDCDWPSDGPWGDVNCSGTVTSVDANAILNYVAGNPQGLCSQYIGETQHVSW